MPATVLGGQQGMESTKHLPPKRKRSSRAVKSKEYVEDSESEEGVGEVLGGETEEDELMIPVDIEEQPKKKKKVNAPPINHEGVIPPVGSTRWTNLLICDRCRAKGQSSEVCIVEAPGYSCVPCKRWKENCSRVPPQWNKLRRRRLTEREEVMWKVCGIEPSASVPAQKASGHAARKKIEQSSPPSMIFGPRSRQLALKKKSQKRDEKGQKDLSVINEVCERLVPQGFLTQTLQEKVQEAPVPAAQRVTRSQAVPASLPRLGHICIPAANPPAAN